MTTTYATWNPSDKHANITLTDGNLKAVASGTLWKSVRSTIGKSSGKWYWEIAITSSAAGNYHMIGAGTPDASLSTYVGGNTYGYSYYGTNGKKVYNTSQVAYGGTYGVGYVIGVALDLDNGMIWFSNNGVWQASGDPETAQNPAYTGISGTFYAMFSPYTNTNAAIANFGASAFAYSVPSGFNSGLYDSEEGETELIDASLDLAAYYRKSQDLASFLRAHDGVELHDLIADLEAAAWNIEDLASFLSAYYQDLEDMGMDLSAWGNHYGDLKSFLAAFFQGFEDDMKTGLETWATGYGDIKALLEAAGWGTKDLPTQFCAWGRKLASLPAFLRAVKHGFKDLAVLLYVTNGTVLSDLGSYLAATDGSVMRDLGLCLGAIRSVPAFRSTGAQKVSSVIHEVS